MQKNTVTKTSNKPELVAGRCLALWYVGSSVSTMMSSLMQSPLHCITNTNTQIQWQQNNLNLGPLRHQKPMMSRWLHLFSENARVLTFTLHQKRTRPSFICQVVCTKTIVLNALLEAMVCTIFTVELLDFNNTFPDCPCSLTLSSYEDNWTFLTSQQWNFSWLPDFCTCALCMPETFLHLWWQKQLITN